MDKKGLGADAIQIPWRINEWFSDISSDNLLKLKDYFQTIHQHNKSINLISVKTLPVIDVVHFADCIIASKHIFSSTQIDEIYDFGSGNGFPGIIIAILYPNVKVHIVEIDVRKAEFLKSAAKDLKLSNVNVLVRTMEALPEGSVKFAVSRGFTTISKAILISRKIIPQGGKYFHIKSEEWATEIGAIPTQLCSYWTPTLISEYKLPIGNVKFAVVCTQRTNLK